MHKNLLTELGLQPKEANVYEALLKRGQATPQELAQETKLKRATVYFILDALSERKLAFKVKTKGKIHYQVEHPSYLEELIKEKEEVLVQKRKSLSNVLPRLISDYNLNISKPLVKYFEGKEGIKLVINDSLNTKTEILSYVDIRAVAKYVEKINKKYIKKREELKIKKRIIAIDSPFVRNYLKKIPGEITDLKLIDKSIPAFETVMQIYDNKVAYLTLSEKHIIGVIIEDKTIYNMHKALFEFVWKNAKKV